MIFLIVNDFNEQQPLTYGNKFVKNNFTIIYIYIGNIIDLIDKINNIKIK